MTLSLLTIDVDEYDIEPYPFHGEVCRSEDTWYQATAYSSDQPVDDSLSLQEAWDSVTNDYKRWTDWARARNKKITTDIQSFCGKVYTNGNFVDYRWRNPTPAELLCNVNLALCYDIRQIYFWKYNWTPGYDFSCAGGIHGLGSKIDLEGLLRDSSGVVVPTQNWYSARDVVGPAISGLIPHLEQLDWQAVARNDDATVRDYVDSVVSAQYEPEDMFVHLGFYSKADECARYIFLINKRCLPSETTSLSVHFKRNDLTCATGEAYNFFAKDVVTDQSIFVESNWDGSGRVLPCYSPEQLTLIPDTARYWFTLSLAPGQGRLIKIWPAILDPCICGDVNNSNTLSISDAVYIVAYIFSGGPAPQPMESGDVNCSGGVSISDAVSLVNYIFAGGAAPCTGGHCP